MKRQRGEASGGGIGVLGLLGAIFITLKLLGVEPVASWSWWWVTAPLWAGFVVALVGFGVYAVFAVRRQSRR